MDLRTLQLDFDTCKIQLFNEISKNIRITWWSAGKEGGNIDNQLILFTRPRGDSSVTFQVREITQYQHRSISLYVITLQHCEPRGPVGSPLVTFVSKKKY